MLDWRVRVFGPSDIVDRPSYCMYIRSIPLSGCMNIRSCYRLPSSTRMIEDVDRTLETFETVYRAHDAAVEGPA